jgi:long-subunit acyl-CoA synthetase (AMP-forming)
MLTSGSTGNAKAVPLRHKEILGSVRGKASIHAVAEEEAFLN